MTQKSSCDHIHIVIVVCFSSPIYEFIEKLFIDELHIAIAAVKRTLGELKLGSLVFIPLYLGL